jgi:hypothetical protein
VTAIPALDIDLNDLDLFADGDIHGTFALLRRRTGTPDRMAPGSGR